MQGGDGSCRGFSITLLSGYKVLQKGWVAALVLVIVEMVVDLNGDDTNIRCLPIVHLMVLPYFLPGKHGL